MNRLPLFALSVLALGLAACAATPTTPVATTPAPQAAVAAEEIAPEDRAAFFVQHARNGECDKVSAELDAGGSTSTPSTASIRPP